MKVLSKAEKKFLIGLEKLTRETGIVIGGCGCCGSPFLNTLTDIERGDEAGYGLGFDGEVCWLSPSECTAIWKHLCKTIVKEKRDE